MDKKFFIVLVITIFMFASAVFTQDSSLLPGILRSNIIIFGIICLLFLLGYGYVPITKIGQKTKIYLFLAVLSILIGSLIYSATPPLLSNTEKEYIQHLDSGYSFFQNHDYERALNEYKIAENIYKEDSELYIFKAYCYQSQKEYSKAIENAKVALKYPDSKSIYKKAHNFKLINLNNDVKANTIIGECAYEQKQYKEAKEAYSYVIEHVTYKYTDAYIYRGICEYYLNEKQAALNDFEKHRQIINSYIDDQANSDYPSKYPTYTNKDLILVSQWINAAQKL